MMTQPRSVRLGGMLALAGQPGALGRAVAAVVAVSEERGGWSHSAFVGTHQPHGPLEVLWLVKLDVDAESLRQSPGKELGLL